MSETTKAIPRDVNTDPVSSYYNTSADAYQVTTGSGGAIDVNVKSIVALASGTNNIGDVDVLTLPSLPSGDNNIGNVDIVTMPNVTIGTALPAGDNNIGNVDIVTMPNVTIGTALPSGTNNIGDVDVLTLPPLPAGTNNIGDVDVLSLPPLPSGTNNIGDVDVLTLPAIPAGSNIIGKVGIDQTAGQNIVYVGQMKKGTVTTAHNAIVATTTSNEIDCTGFNSLMVECDVSAITSGNWVIDVRGTLTSGGTVGDCYDLNAATPTKLTTGTMNANGKRIFLFRGIPDYVKILATRTTDGTLTCKVQPLNL